MNHCGGKPELWAPMQAEKRVLGAALLGFWPEGLSRESFYDGQVRILWRMLEEDRAKRETRDAVELGEDTGGIWGVILVREALEAHAMRSLWNGEGRERWERDVEAVRAAWARRQAWQICTMAAAELANTDAPTHEHVAALLAGLGALEVHTR